MRELSIRSWIDRAKRNWQSDKKRAVMEAAYCLYLGPWFTATSRRPIGTNVYDLGWDALIILDACRVDALRYLAPEYDFLDARSIDSIVSVGSGSREWLVKTFNEDHLEDVQETALVSANGFDRDIFMNDRYLPGIAVPFCWPGADPVTEHDFLRYDPVWRDCRDERLDTVPPEATTNRAILAGREADADRLVVHYAQPHTPYIADAATDGGRELTDIERSAWGALKQGSVPNEVVWRMYLNNLRHALDSVGVLLENLDAEKVVLSADHGEAFGEWGIQGHPTGLPHPHVKRVPWATTTATDYESVATDDIASPAANSTEDDGTVEEHLEALGYGKF
ncbi:hypothetical protein [Natronosalvus caseinilyticus]|uniref:hypothetical protein n=1 Tax=Natronosalvus caseinilyticus TaxID=2953747 RepID=UPI0028B1025D|nr:hypothetical protein [Natronosalvus caseinilyticus]